MEEILSTVAFGLLFGVYWYTIIKDNELFSDVSLKEVKHPTARFFLIVRYVRIIVGNCLLGICASRFFFACILEPIMNFILRILDNGYSFTVELANERELWMLIVFCTVLLGAYGLDKLLQIKLIKEFGEEENDS